MTTQAIEYDVHTDHFPINIYQGETWNMSIAILDGNGNPFSLTGYTAEMTARESPGGPILFDLTSGSGITIDGSNGTIGYSLTAAQTAALEFTSGIYDTFIKSGSNTVTPLLKGPANLTLRTTRMS